MLLFEGEDAGKERHWSSTPKLPGWRRNPGCDSDGFLTGHEPVAETVGDVVEGN